MIELSPLPVIAPEFSEAEMREALETLDVSELHALIQKIYLQTGGLH